MLTKDALIINELLEAILNEPNPHRDYRLEKLAMEVEFRFGNTPEGQMIVEGIRSWITTEEQVNEAG